MEKSRIIVSCAGARRKLQKGVEKVAEVVGSTLGPAGRNVLIDRGYRFPIITNDGITVAREIILDDEIEQMGAMTIIEAAKRTNQDAGDGTTTSTVIAAKILDKGFTILEENENAVGAKSVMNLKREIDAAKLLVIEEIKKRAVPINGKEDLERISITAMENEELGKQIADMVEKVGIDGCITVEESLGDTLEIDVVQGMRKMGTYAHPGFQTNDKREAIFEEVPVLVATGTVENPIDLKQIADDLLKQGINKLAIFAEKYSKDVINFGLFNKAKGTFAFLFVKTPALMPEEIEDIAIYTGAKLLDQTKGGKWKNYDWRDLGKARKIIVTMDNVTIMDGNGTKISIESRIDILRKQMEIEIIEPVKLRLQRQLGAMASGVGVIKVGSKAYTEASYLRLKIEDAVHAVKCAMEEGIVKGGGLCLKEIAESLPENILTDALKAPYEKIQDNAGERFEIPDSVIDPAKVVRCAVENACSVAGTLLTTNSVIAQQREDNLGKDLIKALQTHTQEDAQE